MIGNIGIASANYNCGAKIRTWTSILFVGYTVAVKITSNALAGISYAIIITVFLIKVRERRTIVAGISPKVTITVFLIRVWNPGAAIIIVGDTIAICVNIATTLIKQS